MKRYSVVGVHVGKIGRGSVCGLLAVVIAVGLWLAPGAAIAGTPLYPSENERLGFGVTKGIQNYDVSPLHAGWYVNWGTAPQTAHPAGLDFAQIIRTTNAGYTPSGDALMRVIDRSPGSLWLIGNEPDCPHQDNTRPDAYARVYHSAYTAIKTRDPSARVAIGGIVQATPLRLQWLDAVWTTYQTLYGQTMPVDVWNTHAFVLREVRPGHGRECMPAGQTETGEWGAGIPPGISANCGLWVKMDELDRLDIFREQIVRFRTWMRDHGQQNKPLVVSEYGILFNEELGYPYARVRDYMLATFDYFMSAHDLALGYPADDYRLVQQWAWYSLDDDNFGWGTTHSALMNPATKALYPLGADFARYAAARITPYVDLQPASFRATTPNPVVYGQTGVVRLEVDIRNQGNTASAASQVRFWNGVPNAGGTLLGSVAAPAVPSRYAGTVTAKLDWQTAAHGKHEIAVEVDAANQVAESREDNNLLIVSVDFGAVNLAVGPTGWRVQRGPLRAGEAASIILSQTAVTLTQPAKPSPGLTITPPAYQATWYDGDPQAGGQVIASHVISAPLQFGQSRIVPAQTWTPIVTSPRTAWLVVGLGNDAPETSLADNRVGATAPATTDLTLVQVRQVGVPLARPGDLATAHLQFQLANSGAQAPAVQATVGVWRGLEPVGASLGRVGLASGSDWTVSLAWPDLPIGAHTFVAVVDPDQAIPESNEGNNRLVDIALVARQRLFFVLMAPRGRLD